MVVEVPQVAMVCGGGGSEGLPGPGNIEYHAQSDLVHHGESGELLKGLSSEISLAESGIIR